MASSKTRVQAAGRVRRSVTLALLPLVLPMVLIAGCQDDPAARATTAPGASKPASPAPTPTASASQTAPASSPAVTQTATPTQTASASPTASRTPAPWPKALGEPQQGGTVWGVYLAVAHAAGDPVIEASVRSAATVGYQAVVGDVACDHGAMNALHLDQYDYWSGAALYFGNRADAQSFVTSYTSAVRAPRGLAKITLGCLD